MPGEASVLVQRLETFEAGRRPVHHRVGDGVVKRHHRVVRHSLQQAVEREDLRPVGVFNARGFVVQRGDRRLQLIRADGALRAASPVTSATPSAIAARSQSDRSCFVERNQLAVGPGAGRVPRVRQQHQRQQAADFPIVGQESMNAPAPAGSPRSKARFVAAPAPALLV